MSKILANQIANYGDDSPIELKEGLNIPAGKPLQAAGASGSNGQVLTSTGSTVQWTTPFDGDYGSLTNLPTIPAAQVRADWNAVGTVAEILNKPTVPATPSIVIDPSPAGSGNLTYSPGNGQFTFTQPDLSGYLTAEVDTLDTVTGRGASTTNQVTLGKLTVSNDGNANGQVVIEDLGSHSQIQFYASNGTPQSQIQGVESNMYIYTPGIATINTYAVFYAGGDVTLNNGQQGTTTFGNGFTVQNGTISGIDIEDLDNVDITAGLSDQQVLKWDAASTSWKPANDLVGGAQGIAFTDLSVSTAPAGSAALSYNNINGVFTYTPPDLSGYATTAALANASNWDTAFGWGDHSVAGYLTTETDPVFAASPAANVTLTKINQWDTAYGWGNHANGGYLTTETDPVFSASTAAGITGAQVANWNTAYGWGDHSTQGYLTSVALNGISDVTITSPSSGQVLTYNGSGWVNSAPTGGGGANVTISDTAPGSPSAGDLWWESDKGRLKIYYNDTDSSQWVDASPPLGPTSISDGTSTITTDTTGVTPLTSAAFKVTGSLIPDTNVAYDLGTAEHKWRDIYLDSATIHTSDGNISTTDGVLSFDGQPVVLVSQLQSMMASANSFDEFKNAIMGL